MANYGDALSAPFWEAATRHELVVQRCAACGHHQFSPRPYCLACHSDNIVWVQVAGGGTIYAQTTVHIQIAPDFTPPYTAALVELDEGPRLLTNIVGGETQIGDEVRLMWRERDGEPPLPIFTPNLSST